MVVSSFLPHLPPSSFIFIPQFGVSHLCRLFSNAHLSQTPQGNNYLETKCGGKSLFAELYLWHGLCEVSFHVKNILSFLRSKLLFKNSIRELFEVKVVASTLFKRNLGTWFKNGPKKRKYFSECISLRPTQSKFSEKNWNCQGKRDYTFFKKIQLRCSLFSHLRRRNNITDLRNRLTRTNLNRRKWRLANMETHLCFTFFIPNRTLSESAWSHCGHFGHLQRAAARPAWGRLLW